MSEWVVGLVAGKLVAVNLTQTETGIYGTVTSNMALIFTVLKFGWEISVNNYMSKAAETRDAFLSLAVPYSNAGWASR